MDKQTVKDIKKYMAAVFDKDPQGFLAYHIGTDQVFIEKEKMQPIRRGGKQPIKIP